MSLKEARKQNKLKEFIKERSKNQNGDVEKFYKTLDFISHPEKSKSTQETSSQNSSENENGMTYPSKIRPPNVLGYPAGNLDQEEIQRRASHQSSTGGERRHHGSGFCRNH